ncbi:MAG: cadmium-translocating P-type ATPase [Ruminococcaceae bacterium]|nr:cadmium-translocating P-type ATPase [Oscillospiraceae bacterium]
MNKKDKKLLKRIIVSLILFICGVLINHRIIEPVIFVLSYLIAGYDVVKKAFERIIKRKFLDENFLMATASIGAFLIGDYSEAVAVIIFYQVGEIFQSCSVNKSRQSISELMSICPDYACIERNGEMVKVYPDEVKIGDILIIKPGDKIPVDGVIVKGKTSFNTAPLTGEPLPKEAEEGDFVSSGFINIDGLIKIRAEKEYSDSTVSKILELVENSTMAKAKTERFITRFSAYYTPIVVALAVCIALIPPFFIGNFSKWLYRALSFLVVSCPCALLISVPLSFFCGIGGASRNGILVKGSNYLEALSKCKTFAFDKTGTLTKGEFEVSEVKAYGINDDEFMKYLAIAEKGSNHPIAKAIAKMASTEGIEAKITEIPGRGVKALTQERVILAGNIKLMNENDIKVPETDECGTKVYLAVDGVYSGYVTASDLVKDESKKAVSELYREGVVKTVMLTGDTAENAKNIAGEVGISEYKARLLPEDKVESVKEIISESGYVAYAGDGMNDAPVLALVDVGIAMGGIGSDASIEAADIVIMDDNLLKIPKAVKIAKKTMRTVRENIIFSIGVKGLVLVLSALGMTNMWMAVFADVGVAVIAILNAMRTMNVK